MKVAIIACGKLMANSEDALATFRKFLPTEENRREKIFSHGEARIQHGPDSGDLIRVWFVLGQWPFPQRARPATSVTMNWTSIGNCLATANHPASSGSFWGPASDHQFDWWF